MKKLILRIPDDIGFEPDQIPEGAIIRFAPYLVDGVLAGYWLIDDRDDRPLAVVPRTAVEPGWGYSASLWKRHYQPSYDWDWEHHSQVNEAPVNEATGLTEEEEDTILLALTIDALRAKGHDFDWDATWEDVAPFVTDENGEWVGSTDNKRRAHFSADNE
jgi:hypothetical protein